MLLQVVNASVLFSSDVQRLLVRLSFVHVAVNIALTWWLSGRYGSVGAAAATSISELFAFAYFGMVVWWLFRRGSLVKSP
jgi:O-antigen/teichoic acid export membrane protein